MKPKSQLIVAILIYCALCAFAINRSMNLRFNGELIALLPSDNVHLSTYKELSRLNNSEGGFDLVIRSNNGEELVTKAKEITAEILELKDGREKIFRTAELENDLYDIRYSALYLMTLDELNSTYSELNEYIDQKKMEENPFYVELEKRNTDNEDGFEIAAESSVLLEEVSNSRRYSINKDSTVIRVSFIPDFVKSNYNKVESAYTLLLNKAEQLEQQYPHLDFFWGGSYVSQYDKINDIQYSVSKALVIGVLSLFLFLIGYMLFVNKGKAYKAVYIIIDLIIVFFILFSGFVISLGISSFIFDEINVFTGIIFSILFGINLDYILHVYSINKKGVLDTSGIKAVVKSYFSSTKPIILSCLTTGLAIMSLIFADFEGFKHFGIIFFVNIIVNLISTYLFLLVSPSLGKQSEDTNSDESVQSSLADVFIQNRTLNRVLLPVILVFIATFAYFGSAYLSFNFNFADLEPQSKPSEFRDLSATVNTGPGYHEPSYYITDTIGESRELFDHIRNNLDSTFTDIERVESFSARYPFNKQELEIKSQKIDSLKALIDSNSGFLEGLSSDTKEFLNIVESTVPPSLEKLPKYIRNRFFYQDGSMAPMVVIYSKTSLSNGETSIAFRKSSGTMTLDSGKTFYAASTYIIASSILELLINESTYLFLTPLLTIVILLLVYYRSVSDMLIAVAPLLLTFMMLLGLKLIFRFDINLYNVIVFPIIIGVGADNGIHLVDSLKNHSKVFLSHFLKDKFPVLSACSVTTILGFMGLLFIDHPGMESIGDLAIAGITGTLLSTFIISLVVESFRPGT